LRFGEALHKRRKLILSLFIVAEIIIYIILIIANTSFWLIYTLLFVIFGASYGMIILKTNKNTENDLNLSAIEETLQLADKTFLYLKDGLDNESALFVAQIIKDISNIPAVAITDREKVLTFLGEGCKKHQSSYPIKTQATLDAISDGKMRIIRNNADFDCRQKDCNCPMSSVVIIPLYDKKNVVGCMKFYGSSNRRMSEETIKQAVGIGKLLSMQIQLASYDRQIQLNTEAKLDALQAQINPHFLFNTLNTIKMYINKDTEYARQLIVSLATMLRYLLGKFGRFITLGKEISYIKDYIAIEKARYLDRITIKFILPKNIDNIEVPVFCIQPIVHNAVIHGILPKDSKGIVVVRVVNENNELLISIEDNGVGMKEEQVIQAYKSGFGSGCGIGLSNVNERLKILYGEDHGIKISSEYMHGTTVSFKIPIDLGEST